MQSHGYILNKIYLSKHICQCSRLWWVTDKGKRMEGEVSGRKRRKRGVKSVQSPQHRTIVLMPPYDRSVGLNYSCQTPVQNWKLCACTAISPICNSIPLTVGKFSTELSLVPELETHSPIPIFSLGSS